MLFSHICYQLSDFMIQDILSILDQLTYREYYQQDIYEYILSLNISYSLNILNCRDYCKSLHFLIWNNILPSGPSNTLFDELNNISPSLDNIGSESY
jgi:hypothetical protein